jgi:hypothetical protein
MMYGEEQEGLIDWWIVVDEKTPQKLLSRKYD